jgi:hypothetical protein
MVGPQDGEGAESSGLIACTPEWLLQKYRSSEVLLGRHKLILFNHDYLRLRQFIEKSLLLSSGDTWIVIAQKVSLLGQWELEGYRPYSR